MIRARKWRRKPLRNISHEIFFRNQMMTPVIISTLKYSRTLRSGKN